MKTIRMSLFVCCLVGLAAAAQAEQIVVPLSAPGQPATVEVGLTNGSITVEAHDGSEVVVEINPQEMPPEKDKGKGRDGLRRLPNSGVAFAIEEEDNVVDIESESWKQAVDVSLRVPANTSLHLSTINQGNIEIQGVRGSHELDNVNGWIKALDVSGSVVASTTNGDVVITLRSIAAETAMAFSSFNGDVDVTMPGDLRADLSMRSNEGDILTDFDIQLSAAPPKIERRSGGGGFSYRMENETRGQVNGGGPEMTFRTYNGDIILRKAKP